MCDVDNDDDVFLFLLFFTFFISKEGMCTILSLLQKLFESFICNISIIPYLETLMFKSIQDYYCQNVWLKRVIDVLRFFWFVYNWHSLCRKQNEILQGFFHFTRLYFLDFYKRDNQFVICNRITLSCRLKAIVVG